MFLTTNTAIDVVTRTMSKKKKKITQTVDATYITQSGISFDFSATWPHENFIVLRWKHPDSNSEITIEFVYFGTHKNRLVYHEVLIEEFSQLC